MRTTQRRSSRPTWPHEHATRPVWLENSGRSSSQGPPNRSRGWPMSLIASIDLQTLGDAFGLGAIYALMAIGIGLVFGVLRLVNFAYGQLIMAGAYALALTQDEPVLISIGICFAVVLGLSLAMELAVFRPLRTASPTTMLVATFAISFLLQSIALARFGAIGKIVVVIPGLTTLLTVGGLNVRWITPVTIVVAVCVFGALTLFLNRTTIGLQMRAASIDSDTARLLGVRANAVITVAVLIS